MGTIHHHAIVVTHWDPKAIEIAHAVAGVIFPEVSPILHSEYNGYSSFFIPPDGSKEGWLESDRGDLRRHEFIDWLYSHPEYTYEWVEIIYGKELFSSIVNRCSPTD